MKTVLFLLIFSWSFAANTFAQNWTPITTPLPNIDFFGIDFLNDTVGIITGETFVSFSANLMITHDGGNTWQLDLASQQKMRSVAMMDDQTAVAVGRSNGSGTSVIARTSDGGQNWSTQNQANVFETSIVSRVDAQTAYAVGSGQGGNSGQVRKTTDGGATWNLINQGFLYHYGAFFVNDSLGFTTSIGTNTDGYLLRTDDGGATFTIALNIANSAYHNPYFVNDSVGFVAEDAGNGVIRKTTDGGLSWNTGASVSPSIHDMAFIDENNGYAVGPGGNIIMTLDGGASWVADMSPTSNPMHGIAVTPRYVYAVGSNTTVIRKEFNIASGIDPRPLYDVHTGPNPFAESSYVRVDSDLPEGTEMSLLDLSGQVIWEGGMVQKGRNPIPGDGLAAGVYFVWLHQQGQTVYMARMLKE